MKKVLIVDDSKFSRNTLKKFLEAMEYEIVGEAVDGLDGLAKHKELHPNIIITDIEMPNFDGISMIKEIRKTDKDVKIVIASSVTNANLLQEVKQLHVAVARKPIKESTLEMAIKSFRG